MNKTLMLCLILKNFKGKCKKKKKKKKKNEIKIVPD